MRTPELARRVTSTIFICFIIICSGLSGLWQAVAVGYDGPSMCCTCRLVHHEPKRTSFCVLLFLIF